LTPFWYWFLIIASIEFWPLSPLTPFDIPDAAAVDAEACAAASRAFSSLNWR
jgi:hypothetical protein